jgi:hypothetical protein
MSETKLGGLMKRLASRVKQALAPPVKRAQADESEVVQLICYLEDD